MTNQQPSTYRVEYAVNCYFAAHAAKPGNGGYAWPSTDAMSAEDTERFTRGRDPQFYRVVAA